MKMGITQKSPVQEVLREVIERKQNNVHAMGQFQIDLIHFFDSDTPAEIQVNMYSLTTNYLYSMLSQLHFRLNPYSVL